MSAVPVDHYPGSLCVRRDTERVVIPERGVPMGNFGVCRISPDEAWITVGEFMWPAYVERNRARERGARGAVLCARVRWERPDLAD